MAVGAKNSGDLGGLSARLPILRRLQTAGLILVLACFATFLVVSASGQTYEAQAVVQIRDGVDVLDLIEAKILGRDALMATAERQGLTGQDAGVTILRAVALHDLSPVAGATLGLGSGLSGVVIAVRLPEAEQAVRVANDLALQVLDLGQNGQMDQNDDTLAFYRAEEELLWHEISALQAESSHLPEGAGGQARKLMLLHDQYDVIRRHLAEEEVAARLNARTRADQFSLLQRATDAHTVETGQWIKRICLAASAALAAALAISALGNRTKTLESIRRERRIFGIPLFVGVTVGLVSALLALAEVLR